MKFIFLAVCLAVCFEYSTGFHSFFGHSKQPTCRIPRKCEVKILAQEHYGHCKHQRQVDIARARYWYQITDQQKTPVIRFPLRHIPWLNQTIENLGAYYATDDFESGYVATFSFYINTVSKAILQQAQQTFKNVPFDKPQEFRAVRRFTEYVLKNKVKIPLFDNPSAHPDFTDHISTDDWEKDSDFSQRRVAGQCPYALRKIVDGGQNLGIKLSVLKTMMNKEILSLKFNTGNNEMSFQDAVDDGRLFVEYYEVMDHVKTDYPDVTPVTGKKERPVASTLTFFIINDDGHLSVVAIQTDSNPTAAVFTPNSPKDDWQIAKILSDSVKEAFCQSYIHLGHLHFYGTIYCLSFRRHLSERHPLYDFMKFHCEGTVMHISTVYGVLAAPDSTGDKYYTMGNEGFVQVSNQAFLERKYGKLDYENLINKRGLDDPRIKYYPFRDDSKLILDEYKNFAKRFTKYYYQHGYFHKTDLTRHDVELQSWARELSDGIGQVPDFPKVIENHVMLEKFIVRFLWLNIVHATCNYAMAANFYPTAPTKVYEADGGAKLTPHQVFFNGSSATEFTSIRDRLINFRVNRIFDYSDKVKDWKLKELVRQTHYRMHVCLQKKLAERNAERKKKNLLGYQFIEPKWITCSIHI